jgi:hypothetical protein
MTCSNARKEKNPVDPIVIPTLEIPTNPGSILVTDTTHHTREYHYPRYDEIYKTFNNEDLSPKDEHLIIYQKIYNSGIHHVVACMTLFPCNDVAQWCFKKFDLNTTTIVIQLIRQIVSLKPGDIGARYLLPKPLVSLNEPFLKGFAKNNKYPAELLEDWWLDEDRKFKPRQRSIPSHEFKITYMMLIAILSRLYGEEKSTHF